MSVSLLITYHDYPFLPLVVFFFFFNDTAPTEIYPLPLHDALPICPVILTVAAVVVPPSDSFVVRDPSVPTLVSDDVTTVALDRKSTRLNSSHQIISYAVFCLKKKKHKQNIQSRVQSLSSLRADGSH